MNYLIENTTKEERIQLANNALTILLTDAVRPDEKTLNLINEYIEGRMELTEVTELIVKENSND